MTVDPDYLKEIERYNIRQAFQYEKNGPLVIDMQCKFSDIAGRILGNVISLIHTCKATGVKIFLLAMGILIQERRACWELV
jgi:hypothetical protein